MICPKCEKSHRKNIWSCPACGSSLEGGVVFITSISGSGADKILAAVAEETKANGHNHPLAVHDVGRIMYKFAKEHEPDIKWDRILDADQRALRYLRALAFQQIANDVKSNSTILHLVDLHLSCRWFAYLTKGFEPHILGGFVPYLRCYINLIQDLSVIQENLSKISWGKRKILELLIWRDEELFLTDLFSDIFGPVDSYAVATREPPSEIERLIWHPEVRKVYLSFPITEILEDNKAREEIESFRDRIRKFLIVFDPYACKDYDETYKRSEMNSLRKEVGETTVVRDFRFIDQADAVVVYFPRKVSSKGVDAEMNHARRTGKTIFFYCPEDPGGGPFAVPASDYRHDIDEFVDLLKSQLS